MECGTGRSGEGPPLFMRFIRVRGSASVVIASNKKCYSMTIFSCLRIGIFILLKGRFTTPTQAYNLARMTSER